jgi:long-chain acyl-CoA synthetase
MKEKEKEKAKQEGINQALLHAMDKFAGRVCLKVKLNGRYQDVYYGQFRKLAFSLIELFRRQGLVEGDRVAIVVENSAEWMVSYVASLLSGVIVVPLNPLFPPEVLRFALEHSGASVGIFQTREQSNSIQVSREAFPALKTLLFLEHQEKTQSGLPFVFTMAEALSTAVTSEEEAAIRGAADRIEPGALASIIYTIKETGKVKGVVFDHQQTMLGASHIAEWFALDENDLGFTLVNWGYVPSLVATLNYFLSGIANVLAEGMDKVFENLQETSPTVIMTIPSGFEFIHSRVMDEINQLPESRRKVFQWALATGKEYRTTGLAASEELRERYTRADMTFFNPIRAMMGGRLRRIYSAGAPLSQELFDFAEVIGLMPLNIYGTYEAGGFPAVSRPNARRPGSCGQVGPGFQVRIADDGEVLVRGETVAQKYWKEPDGIKQVLDQDGWLHTGDLGRFDKDGYLYIIGHKQSLIVLSAGMKVIPTKIENALIAHPMISQALVFGEGRPYISALIVPNLQTVTGYSHGNGGDEIISNISHPKVKVLLDKAVAEVNGQLNMWEKIEAYTLIDQPLVETTGELNDSAKINRHSKAEQFATYINAMYPMTIRMEEKAVTQVQLHPEQLRELLEKQDILDAWMKDAGIEFLFDLAMSKQIDAPSMVHICETAAAIAQMQSEEKPLSTALVVGDPGHIARILPESEIQLQRYDHIRRMRQVVISLSKMVDGLVLGYGVDKHGYLRRIHKLEVRLDEPDTFLLGPQFRHHAAISKQCDAVVFFVPAGGRQVRVFADGQLVGRYSNGNWSSESIPLIDEAVARLAEQKQYDLTLMRRVFRCAFRMSEENQGAIFLLGDASIILERSDPPTISTFAMIINAEIERLTDRELINFAKQDGATIIDIKQGKFRGCMVLLRPRADTRAEIGLGKGARHSSAAKMSAEADCLAITVSQDGPITVYDRGQRILSF